MKKQINNAEHVVMDVEHAHLLMRVAQQIRDDGSRPERDYRWRQGESDHRSSVSRSSGGDAAYSFP